jgi:hypothetical protein
MTSENSDHPTEGERERKFYLVAGIYRVVKDIDDKVERMLDELAKDHDSEGSGYFADPYWYDNGHDPIY